MSASSASDAPGPTPPTGAAPAARIDVAYDGTDTAEAAVAWAANEAVLRGVALRVLHVDLWAAPLLELPVSGAERQLEADVLEDGIAVARRAAPGVVVTGARLRPPAGPALVAGSVGAELLVLGASGLGPMQRLVLGSVSRHCLERARSTVVVVRDAPPDASDRSPTTTR